MFLILGIVILEGLLAIASAALLIWVWMVAQHFAVPYVPTRRRVVEDTLAALKLDNARTFYDLGSGDGRVVLEALIKYPTLHGTGVEKRAGFVLLSRIKAKLYGLSKRAEFKTDDIFSVDLSGIDRAYTFLSHPMMAQLEEKFEKEFHGRLVSLGFPFPRRVPVDTIELAKGSRHYNKLYVYEFRG